MKRLNPNTNEPFKYGETRGDGYRFYNYKTERLSTGFFGERWLRPEVFARSEERDRFAKHKKRRQAGKPTRVTRGKLARQKVKEALELHV